MVGMILGILGHGMTPGMILGFMAMRDGIHGTIVGDIHIGTGGIVGVIRTFMEVIS